MEYRNIQTGELSPGHRIGTDMDGRPLYQCVEGYEPLFIHELAEDGNWIYLRPLTPAHIRVIESSRKMRAAGLDGNPLLRALNDQQDEKLTVEQLELIKEHDEAVEAWKNEPEEN